MNVGPAAHSYGACLSGAHRLARICDQEMGQYMTRHNRPRLKQLTA